MIDRTPTWIIGGLVLTWWFASTAAAAPTDPRQVVLRLKVAKPDDVAAAVKEVNQACRGRLRRALRDHPMLLTEVRRRSQRGPVAARKAVLDTYRCFSPAKFRTVVGPLLTDNDPQVVAYAAEVAARTEDPGLVASLLSALKVRRSACMKPGLAAADVEVCVWLTYAPGACLSRATLESRHSAGRLAAGMFASPYPKVREVAVETVAATRLKVHANDVADLIRREKSQNFETSNTPGLLKRFEQRRRALLRGE